jgi:hypothetical protein
VPARPPARREARRHAEPGAHPAPVTAASGTSAGVPAIVRVHRRTHMHGQRRDRANADVRAEQRLSMSGSGSVVAEAKCSLIRGPAKSTGGMRIRARSASTSETPPPICRRRAGRRKLNRPSQAGTHPDPRGPHCVECGRWPTSPRPHLPTGPYQGGSADGWAERRGGQVASIIDFSLARSLLLALRIAPAMNGARMRENPAGWPRLRRVMWVAPLPAGAQV